MSVEFYDHGPNNKTVARGATLLYSSSMKVIPTRVFGAKIFHVFKLICNRKICHQYEM